MYADTIITRILAPCLESLHAKRALVVLRASAALLQGGFASLSTIALRLVGEITLEHRIKSVDRLLGNAGIHQARPEIVRSVAKCWLVGLPQLLVVVDWSDLTKDQRWQLLRASVVIEGRSITLYEEVHPQKLLANPKVHRRFLQQLKSILPPGCRPIVMTDAGFHAPRFKLVAAHGWDFVGRIRGRNRLQLADGQWLPARDLFARANKNAKDLGLTAYARSNPVAVRAILVKRLPKGRHKLTIHGTKQVGRASAKNARAAREPWLLVSSPSLQHLAAEAIVGLYSQRMRIEQSFREPKNLRVGMGLETPVLVANSAWKCC